MNKYAKQFRKTRVCPKSGATTHAYEFLEYFDSRSEVTAFIFETREAFSQAKKAALASIDDVEMSRRTPRSQNGATTTPCPPMSG